MNIFFNVAREIEVENVSNVVHIEAAGCQVSSHQYPNLAYSKYDRKRTEFMEQTENILQSIGFLAHNALNILNTKKMLVECHIELAPKTNW